MQTIFEALTIPLEYNPQGVIRIRGTRVTLDSVMAAFYTGATPEEIVYRFPTLQLDDCYAVISYALRHPDTVQAYLARQESREAESRALIEDRFPADDIRARLLARRAASQDNNGA